MNPETIISIVKEAERRRLGVTKCLEWVEGQVEGGSQLDGLELVGAYEQGLYEGDAAAAAGKDAFSAMVGYSSRVRVTSTGGVSTLHGRYGTRRDSVTTTLYHDVAEKLRSQIDDWDRRASRSVKPDRTRFIEGFLEEMRLRLEQSLYDWPSAHVDADEHCSGSERIAETASEVMRVTNHPLYFKFHGQGVHSFAGQLRLHGLVSTTRPLPLGYLAKISPEQSCAGAELAVHVATPVVEMTVTPSWLTVQCRSRAYNGGLVPFAAGSLMVLNQHGGISRRWEQAWYPGTSGDCEVDAITEKVKRAL